MWWMESGGGFGFVMIAERCRFKGMGERGTLNNKY